MAQEHKNLRVVLPTVETVKDKIEPIVSKWKVPVMIVTGELARYDAFAASDIALAASGTVSLELAMAGVPHVITYKMNWLTGKLAKPVLKRKIRFVNLINILADKEIIPECLQDDCNLEKIMLQLRKIAGNDGKKQIVQAQEIMQQLGAGQALTPSQKAADVVLDIIKKSKKK